jgi:hypothetical protein
MRLAFYRRLAEPAEAPASAHDLALQLADALARADRVGEENLKLRDHRLMLEGTIVELRRVIDRLADLFGIDPDRPAGPDRATAVHDGCGCPMWIHDTWGCARSDCDCRVNVWLTVGIQPATVGGAA